MAEYSKIEWTDHTFNPWIGCTKVSPGCDNCYAEGWATRSGQVGWGSAQRKRTSFAYWQKPLKWDAAAKSAGERHRVFCASLADVFDNDRSIERDWRLDLWHLIQRTPNLDWLLLTKRPQNISSMLPPLWGQGWPNVWLGTTVENQKEADRRIPHLLAVPAAVRFLSCEPLLGPVDIRSWLRLCGAAKDGECQARGCPQVADGEPAKSGRHCPADRLLGHDDAEPSPGCVDWVICGGESGPKARLMHPDWARSLRDQCQSAGVPFFFKQWGEWKPVGRLYDRAGDTAETQAAEEVLTAATSLRSPYDTNETKAQLIDADGLNWANSHCQPPPDVMVVQRVGKANAGRFLDGRIWNEFPDMWKRLRGAAPDATGDMKSEDFVRRQREEWDK